MSLSGYIGRFNSPFGLCIAGRRLRIKSLGWKINFPVTGTTEKNEIYHIGSYFSPHRLFSLGGYFNILNPVYCGHLPFKSTLFLLEPLFEMDEDMKTPAELAAQEAKTSRIAHNREVGSRNSILFLSALADAEEEAGNPSLANEYRTIASAIETRYQTLKRMGEK